MIRALALALMLALLGACDLRFDSGDPAMLDRRMDRIVLTDSLFGDAEGEIAADALRRAYVHPRLGLALFFTGENGRYRAHFIDQKGLIDLSALMSNDALTRLGSDSAPALAADRRANMPLRVTSLSDGDFRVLPAAGGFLIEAHYGDLWLVSYGAVAPDALRLGNAVDMAALIELAEDAGLRPAMVVLPRLGEGTAGAAPARLASFTSAPPQLRRLLVRHADRVFAPVAAAEDRWLLSPFPAPNGPDDAKAIEAIRASLFAAVP